MVNISSFESSSYLCHDEGLSTTEGREMDFCHVTYRIINPAKIIVKTAFPKIVHYLM